MATGAAVKVKRTAAEAAVPVRPRDAEKTKASILKAARDEFCEQGFNGARVDAIAARAKANKRLLYHYFGNKEALYEAVLLDAYQEIRRGERELRISQYDPIEAVDRIIRFTFRHFLANPWFPRLLSVENLQNARFVKKIRNVDGNPLAHRRRAAGNREARARRGPVPHRCRPDAALHLDHLAVLLLRLQHGDAERWCSART